MSKGNKEEDSKKRTAWKTDSKITMKIVKGDLWKPDKKLTMKLQEALKKRKEKTQ